MKFLFLFMVTFLVAGDINAEKYADEEYATKQLNIYKLFNHVIQYNPSEEQFKLGNAWSIEENKDKYSKIDVVKKYLQLVRHGLLPKARMFSFTVQDHRREAIALFNLFFYAKDWDTFYQTACWARQKVNEVMFFNIFAMAIRQRPDCSEFLLPKPEEIYPFFYAGTDTLQKMRRVLEQGEVNNWALANKEGVYLIDENVFAIVNDLNASYAYENDQYKVAYFTHDLGLSNTYYKFHLDYTNVHPHDEKIIDRSGEMFLYCTQQILAKYYLERLSNGMGEVPRISHDKAFMAAFHPNYAYHTGSPMPSRPYVYHFDSQDSLRTLTDIKDLEWGLRQDINQGFGFYMDGSHFNLTCPEDIDRIGNIILGSPHHGESYRQHESLLNMYRKISGGGYFMHNMQKFIPSALDNYQTLLMDPLYYMLAKHVTSFYYRFKETLPHYTHDELFFKGVKINQVKFTPLITYSETHDYDITNSVYTYTKDNKMQFWGRQERLNHEPFSYEITYTAEQEVESTIRVFLGPKFDNHGRAINFEDNRENFVEIERFVQKLAAGKNTLIRNNADMSMVVHEKPATRELVAQLIDSLKGTYKFPINKTEEYNGWPCNLVLPKGTYGGMWFQVYVIMSPFSSAKIINRTHEDHVKGPYMKSEDIAFGYPLDRPLEEADFFTPNMHLTDVMITYTGHRAVEVPHHH